MCLAGQGQPLGLRPWLGWELGGGAPERRGHVAHSAGSLPTSKHPIIPGRLASTGRAASPGPGSAVPSLPETLIRANCSDISALTGPGARTSRTFSPSGWRWAAFPGLSLRGVRQEEAGGGQAAQVGSAPDPSGEGGMQASVPAALDHRPRQRDTQGLSSPGGVCAMSACMTHSTRGPKDHLGHTLEVTFSPQMTGDTLLGSSPEGSCAFYGGPCRALGWGPPELQPSGEGLGKRGEAGVPRR